MSGGYCGSDIITKCDAELAIYQTSKAKSEFVVSEEKQMEQKQMQEGRCVLWKRNENASFYFAICWAPGRSGGHIPNQQSKE